MMDQQLFNNVVTERIMDFLPPIYAGYKPETKKVNKVNEAKTALMLLPEDKGLCSATPMVYLDDMYELFQEKEDLDDTMKSIANIFMNNIYSPTEQEAVSFDFKSLKNRVVMEIINSERNEELLSELPHREVINMAVIYRVIMRLCDDGGFDSIIVNDHVLEEMGVDRSEVHELAMRNTTDIFEPVIMELSPKALMITNNFQTFGSSAMIISEVMEAVSKRLGTERMYIIPCSIHEFITVQAEGTDLESLVAMLAEGNREFTRECDILSNCIYYYDLKEQKISKAASYI